MSFNQFSVYSVVSTSEKNNSDDFVKILDLISKLESFENESSVRQWLKENWNIKDDVKNFAIASNVRLNAKNGKKYFNVSIETDEDLKVYNFRKES